MYGAFSGGTAGAHGVGEPGPDGLDALGSGGVAGHRRSPLRPQWTPVLYARHYPI